MNVQQKNLLYDFYGELLTDKQRTCFEMHYMEDMSLTEMADAAGITPQAAADMLKRTGVLLDSYEATLGLVDKHNRQCVLAGQINELLTQAAETGPLALIAALRARVEELINI